MDRTPFSTLMVTLGISVLGVDKLQLAPLFNSSFQDGGPNFSQVLNGVVVNDGTADINSVCWIVRVERKGLADCVVADKDSWLAVAVLAIATFVPTISLKLEGLGPGRLQE